MLDASERSKSTGKTALFLSFVWIRPPKRVEVVALLRLSDMFSSVTLARELGPLVLTEDSHLVLIQSTGGDVVSREITINSLLNNYISIERMIFAHSSHFVVTLQIRRDGNEPHQNPWTIKEVAFNVSGLSMDCFIPPADIMYGFVSEPCDLPQERSKSMAGSNRNKLAALEKHHKKGLNIIWRVVV